MNTRVRLVIVASVVVGTLVGAWYYGWQGRSAVVHDFEWSRTLSGPVTLNSIRGIDTSEVARRRFSYYTGAEGGGAGPRASAPTRVLAEAADGSVSVRLLGFDGRERTHARDEALEIARIVSSATTQIFPAPPTPVEIDVHVMPDDAQFSLAKRVDWRDGRAFTLAVFMRETQLGPATFPAHELYHVLALRYSLRGRPVARQRPNAALVYEEATADLFAACGELLARGSLSRAQRVNHRVVVDDRTFENVLAGEELAAALDLIASDSLDRGDLGPCSTMFSATRRPSRPIRRRRQRCWRCARRRPGIHSRSMPGWPVSCRRKGAHPTLPRPEPGRRLVRRGAQVRGSVTPRWPWYLPPRSA